MAVRDESGSAKFRLDAASAIEVEKPTVDIFVIDFQPGEPYQRAN